ncbi:hypothetical protein L3X38_015020 [Prunus dulcis]|uniref:Timeless N-terminal domain-containing protein n=1 Tax=Prunus dulcis TaxID=3755 RepID=A0AAD4WPW0_PRUDU|nr:hypothetical protein L3X38_015020 [Prunus dulcis]
MDLQGLSAICSDLGIAEEDANGNRIGYSKSKYCLDNLKDLLRFLRRDDPQNRDVFKQVCKWKIVDQDLVPIIEHCQDDTNLVLNAVKVLVFLTMPIEPSSNDILQQIDFLWRLKSSITSSDIIAVIVSLLESPLENLESDVFTEDDWKLVQLVLTLFRNILAVQEISLQQKAGGTASQFISLRDGFLELLFHENVMDLVLVITQHIGDSRSYLCQDNLLLLEIFHYIFMGQEPELIANACSKGPKVDGGDTTGSLNSLKSIMEEEEEEKKRLSRLRNMDRHSHFSGTFTQLTLDGSKAVLKGKPTSASCNTLLKPHSHRGPIKKIAWDHGTLPSTKDEILELLHDFVNQFLSGGYNVLMQSIRADTEKEHHAIQNSDVIIFFQVAQFVTSFQYHKSSISKPSISAEADTTEAPTHKDADITFFRGDVCGPIAASMNESMFQLVISKWRYAFDGLKETHDYKFLSAAGSLLKIMIRMLDLVLKLLPENSKEPQTARILLYKLFYDQTDEGMTHFLINLLKSFDTHKQPRSDFADLVEMVYKVLRLMENLQACGTLRVSKKSRKARKKKIPSEKETENTLVGEHATTQKEISISNGEHSTDVSVTENRSLTTSSNGKEDINILVQPDECKISFLETENLQDSLAHIDCKTSDDANGDLCYSTGDSSADEQVAATDEVDFKVSNLISAFSNINIIQKLCWLLKFYKSNLTSTNHYIVCMLRRISDDLELSPMLYQLSLLTTFYDILVEQKSSPCKAYETIVDFLTNLVRKMLKKMKNQPLLFVEILFWKTRKECHYINAEYLMHELGHLKKESRNWANSLGDEEIGQSLDKGWTSRSIADALGEDEADVVLSHELGHENSGENFGKVKGGTASISDNEIDGQENYDNGAQAIENETEKVSRKNKRLVIGAELEMKIKDLYEKFKDDQNCSHLIAKALDPDGRVSPAQISNKLKQLGLKVVRRKRLRHAQESVSTGPSQIDGDGRVVKAINSHCESNSQPLHTRKRVHAFSEDQETNIRSLYEQLKDHKRCSHMIANAMDGDGKFTASQVSRKLKQLGLYIPRKKRSAAGMLRDEDLNDSNTNKEHDSDDDTLLSLMKRGKKDRSRFSEELLEQTTGRKVSEDDSDDEILSSVLKKTRRPLSKPMDLNSAAISIRGTSSSNALEDGVDEGSAFKHVSPNGMAEAEVRGTGTGTGNPLDAGPVKNLEDLQHEQMDNDLADSGDEMAYGAFPESSVSRRKLRMVLEDEDDD